MRVLHRICGHPLSAGEFCEHCDRPVDRGEISWLRPWVSADPFPLLEPVN
jgi:hypothetical protein